MIFSSQMRRKPITVLEQALSFLSHSDRTKTALIKKLTDKGFDEDESRKVVLALEETGVINDARWVESKLFAMSEMRPCSLRQAQFKLKPAGVDSNLIESKWLELALDEPELCLKAAERKKRVWGKNREKIVRHLVSRGFSWDIISKTLDKLAI